MLKDTQLYDEAHKTIAGLHKLVDDLNDEAQTHRLAVLSREANPVYRVRGYIAVRTERTKPNRHAKSSKPGKTAVTWVWDVYDTGQNRALRISGEAKPASA